MMIKVSHDEKTNVNVRLDLDIDSQKYVLKRYSPNTGTWTERYPFYEREKAERAFDAFCDVDDDEDAIEQLACKIAMGLI